MKKNNEKECLMISSIDNEKRIDFYFKYGDGSNFDFINNKKFQNIKYDKLARWKIDEQDLEYLKDDSYHHIIFDLNGFPGFEEIIKEFEKIINNKHKDEKCSDIFKKIINYFQTYRKDIDIQKLHGDIGEALFILKCLDLGINSINDSVNHKNDTDSYDFILNNFIFEIKTTSKQISEINIKSKQNQRDDNYNIVVVKVDYYQNCNDKNNYLNILDIYSKIYEKNRCLKDFLIEKENYYKSKLDVINNHQINIKSYEMQLFNKNNLPEIQIMNRGALKDLIFVLDASSSLNDINIEEYLLNILK